MSTHPDQHNKKMKVKYVENDPYDPYKAPLFRNICEFNNGGMFYGADGQYIKQPLNMTTEYTKNGKRGVSEYDFDDEFDTTYFPSMNSRKQGNLFNNVEEEQDEQDACNYKKIGKNDREKSIYNGDRYVRCSEKSKYINHASYVYGGSMETGGFGNLNRFSDLKIGEATRNQSETISDAPINRFHYTYRNYQDGHVGSNPLPEDTRYHNKKFI